MNDQMLNALRQPPHRVQPGFTPYPAEPHSFGNRTHLLESIERVQFIPMLDKLFAFETVLDQRALRFASTCADYR
jgi:hypothetical protein